MKTPLHSLVGLILFSLIALCACGGGSSSSAPVSPPVQPGITFVFEDMGALSGFATQIRQLVTSAYESADAVIGVNAVEVKISADASRTIPGWGMGGYALGPNSIELVIDANFADLNQVLAERLPYIVAHELHHVVRWRSTGVYSTLLEAFVFEGMADDFAVQLLESPQPPWTTAFNEDVAELYFDDALDELDGAFDFEAWFLGLNTSRPRWTGYTLGYLLIQRYRLSNPEIGLPQLLVLPANSFRAEIDDAV